MCQISECAEFLYVFVFFFTRLEDVTDPEAIRKDSKCDRNVCLYGYVRGTHLKKNTNIHIPGNVLQYFITLRLT